jgi:hypothetical protein
MINFPFHVLHTDMLMLCVTLMTKFMFCVPSLLVFPPPLPLLVVALSYGPQAVANTFSGIVHIELLV